MAGAIATGYVKLIPTFDKQLTSTIQKQLGGVDGKAAGSKVGKLFSRGVDSGTSGLKTSLTSRFSAASVAVGNVAAKAVTGALSSISGAMDSAIARVDIIENFPKVMSSLGYEAEAASRSMDIMKDAVDGLPTRLQDMTTNVQTLAATMGNLSDGEVNATTVGKAFNDMMLAGGQGTEAASNAFTQYTQMLAVGKVDQQAWNSVVTAAPGQMDKLAKSMLGAEANQKSLYEALKGGEVSFDEFNEAVVRLDKEGGEGFASFEAQAREATQGIGTSMENAKNRVTTALANIVQSIGQSNIAGAIEAVTTKFGEMGKVIGGFDAEGNAVGFVAGLKDGLESALDGWTPSFSIDWEGAFSGAQGAAEKVGEWLSGPIATFVQVTDENLSKIGETWDSIVGGLELPDIDWGAASQGVSDMVAALGSFEGDYITTVMKTIADVGQSIGEVVAPAIEKMQPGFEAVASAAESFVKPIADFLTGNGPAFDGMMERINGHVEDLKPAMDDFGEAFNHLGEAFGPIAETLGPIVAEVLGNIGSALAGLLPIFVEAAAGVTNTVAGFLEAVTTIAGFFSGAIESIQGMWNGLTDFIGSIPGSIQAFFEGIPAFFGGVFDSVRQFIQEKFEGAVDFVRSIPDQIVGFFSGIGESIGNAIGSIHFPQPHVSWEDLKIGDIGIPIPHVEWYRSGGIFAANSPQMIGVGDASVPEAVTPIDKLQDYISEAVGRGGRDVNINLYYTEGSADAQQMMRDIARELRRYKMAGVI